MDFLLVRNGKTLARISGTTPDQPWFEADFEPAPAFEDVRPFFDLDARLLEEDRIDELMGLWDRIDAAGIRLVASESGEPVPGFMLHLEGTRCRLRW